MVRVLVPSGALGLNFDQDALEAGLARTPHVIAIDGGSTDSGPAYLGQGRSKYSRAVISSEWERLMQARTRNAIPLVLGTAGTCGTDSGVAEMLDITREIANRNGEKLRVALLKSSQDGTRLAAEYERGRIFPLPAAPDISAPTLGQCTNIVALAGAEQVGRALETGADIIIAGRTTDTAIISALPLMRGCHAGAAWHGAKIAECGALCATHPQTGVLLAEFDRHGVTLTPMAERSRATPQTVSAHMLYENADPFILHEPGGHLDATGARYTAVDDRSVRVTGARWVPAPAYRVKLEGARSAGFQSVLLSVLRDPRYVKNARQWANDIVEKCREKVATHLGISPHGFSIEIRLIGHSASLGSFETERADPPVELGALGIVTAPEQELADEIGRMLNPYLLHHPLTQEEEQPTFSFPFSPAEISRGETFEFCLNHVWELEDPMDAFQLEVVEIG